MCDANTPKLGMACESIMFKQCLTTKKKEEKFTAKDMPKDP